MNRLRMAAVAGLALAALAGCSAPPPGATSGGDDTIVVLTPDQNTQPSFDAGWSSSSDFYDLNLALNENLIKKPYEPTDQTGVVKQDLYQFEGKLAESYDISPDGTVVTFHLRPGVMSEHGNELTADDVIWSYERKFAATTSVTKYVVAPALTDPTSQIKKVDDHTVTITVPRAGDMFTLLATMADITGQIYDADYLKANGTPDDPYAVKWSSGRSDFGYGPYRIESQTPGTETILTANPNYALGEPEIKRIVRRVAADPANRASALKTGDADVALDLRNADLVDLAQDANVVVPSMPANRFVTLWLTSTVAPFDNPKVREAMVHAIDYNLLVSQAFQDRAQVTNTFLDPDAPGYSGTGLPQWQYDPEKAKALLAEAGYPDGLTFALTIQNTVPGIEDAAVAIQSAAAAAGITVQIDSLPATQYSEKTQSWTAQASLGNWSAISISPPYELMLGTAKGSTSNLANWTDATFDSLVQQGVESGDALTPEAGVFWNQAEKLWLDSASTVYLAKTMPTIAMSSSLSGLTWRTDSAVDYTSLSRTG